MSTSIPTDAALLHSAAAASTKRPTRAAQRTPVGLEVFALVAAAATAIVFMLSVAGASADETTVNLLDDIALVFALFACLRATRRTDGDMRRMWILFSIGVSSWCLGEAVFDVRLIALHLEPVQPLSDALYMLFYPLIIAGLWIRDRRLRDPGIDARVLDSIVIALGVAVIAWGLIFDNATGPEAEAIGAAGRVFYPLLDGVLIWAVAYQLYTRRVVWDITRTLLALAVLSLFAAGVTFILLGRLESGIAVSLAMTLIGFAALAAGDVRAARLDLNRPHSTRFPEAMLLLVFVGVSAIVFAHLYEANPTLVVLAGAATAVMVLRLLTVLLQNFRLLEASEQRAATDPLTGLANRQYFHDRLEAEIARATRDNGRVALLLIDLDNFKTVNDIAGHSAGDHVLTEMAGVLTDSSREFDIACRIGGDELAVIAPEADTGAALEIAQRLCAAAGTVDVGDYPDLPPVSVSIGCSVFPELADDAVKLVDTADEALYRVKQNGRAAAELYSPSAPHPKGAEWQLARVQAELASRDADFKAVFRHAKEAMVIFDENANLLMVNDATTAMFGAPREQMVGRRLSDFVQPQERKVFQGLLPRLLADGQLEGKVDVAIGDRDVAKPRTAKLEYSTSRFAPNRYLTIMWDITAEDAAAELLAENEQRFRAIFESSIDPIFVTDDHGIIRDANIAAAEMADKPLGKLIGSSIEELVHPADVDEVTSQMRELRGMETRRGTFTTRDEHDVVRTVEYSSVADFVPGLHLTIVRDITSRAATHAVRGRRRTRARVLG